MEFDLKTAREKYCLSCKEMGDKMGLQEIFYKKYEISGEVPSKYILKLWQELEDFPIPEDFFYYTSFTLVVNLKYHHMKQQDAADAFGYSNQSTISNFVQENIPMYEKKKEFIETFKPLIVPFEIADYEVSTIPQSMTELCAKGNLMLADIRKQMKEERNKLNIDMKEQKRRRQKEFYKKKNSAENEKYDTGLSGGGMLIASQA